jgi:hypothetical protein
VVACTPPIAAEPPNNEFFVLAVESKFPEEMLTISRADRFGRRGGAADYTRYL